MAAEGRLELLATLKDKASGALRKLKGLAGGIGGAFRKGALIGGAAIVGLGVVAVKAFAGFDDAMTKSLAIMGDVSDEMRDRMETAARDVAKATLFSAEQAAESYFFLASAGLDAAQSIEALPKVAAFAQAGNFDMALATDLLTDAQSALGLSVDDTAENLENMTLVSDVLVKANTLANATVQQFSESLTNKAGPALRAVNKPIAEGVAVLAVFADQGIKGAQAGTQLAIVLRDLQTKAIKNADEFAALGISVFDSEGNMRNMADIVGDLEVGLDGMSDAQAKATLLQLGFSDKSISSLQALLGQSEAIREYQTELEKMGGITDEVANKQLESFTAQMSLLKSAVMDVLITLGGMLVPLLLKLGKFLSGKVLPAVEKFIKGFRGGFKNMGDDARGFIGVGQDVGRTIREFVDAAVPKLKDLWGTFKSGLEVVTPLIKGLFNFIVDNKPVLIGAIVAIGVAILLALGPGAIAVAAIIGLILLIGLVKENFASWKETVEEFVDKVIAKVEGIPVLGEIFTATVAVIGDKITALRGFIQGLIDFVQELVRFVTAIIHGDWATAWDALKNLAQIALGLFLNWLDLTFIGTIKTLLGLLKPWDLIKDAFNAVVGEVGKLGKDWGAAAFGLGRDLVNGIVSGITTGFFLVRSAINVLVGGAEAGINFMLAGIDRLGHRLNRIGGAISSVIGFFGGPKLPSIPHISGITLPRLDAGGRILETGLAVVDKGEEFSGVGGFGRAIVIEHLHLGLGVQQRDVARLMDMFEEEQVSRRRRGR